ncbi:hypothetical protein [Halobaculum roseum]|uniref:Major facilitator superfamily (MFS) profile domain-containing protein n=1 Tax=Halobaculum roseum TaxID=2175149 RepID=A0ABD5MQM7_9EURY|nr:hypothetical protein [Halobaculum roseum]QZY01887.1 hypothetical protein K6T36_11240 [Halobaculum roseum]
MSRFEEMAVLDMQFRILLATTGLAFFGVGYTLYVVFESAAGFVIGGMVAIVVAYLTAKRLP